MHSAYVLYALGVPYGWFSSPLLLLAVQSAAVGLAAVPLYVLARRTTGSVRLALGCSLLFATWAPVLGAGLYDFHVEAFLPLKSSRSLPSGSRVGGSGRWALPAPPS